MPGAALAYDRFGERNARLGSVGGIAAGPLLPGALTAARLAAVLAALPAAHLALTFLGAGYLLPLGAQTLWRHRRAPSTVPAEPGRVVGDPLPGPRHSSSSFVPPSRSSGWAAACSSCPRPGRSSTGPVHRVLGRATGVVLTGFGLAVAGTAR